MEYILETKDITKKYNNSKVLNNLNIHIPKGSIYGLVGKNGAGKTTLIRIITGLQKETSGKYILYGISSIEKEIIDKRKKVGAIIESPALYLNMTAKENLIEQSKILGLPSYKEVDKLLEIVNLENTNKKVKYFSFGMKQRLSIALALVSNPDFIILDEPINGLDPKGIIDIRNLILKLNNKGITFLISSHYLDELSKIATHYGFIDNGTIIQEISIKELKQKLREKTELKVNNIDNATKYLKNNNMNYDIKDNIISIYSKINISKIVIELSKNNVLVENITEKKETLENYYIKLIERK